MAKFKIDFTEGDERSKRYMNRVRYFRRLGFSKWESHAYARIGKDQPRLKGLIEDQKWALREAAAYQDISVKEAARRMARERDIEFNAIGPGDVIPSDYDPYYRLGYGDVEEYHRPHRKKVGI